MKATFRNSFAKRSLMIAATALPSLCAGLANAQTPPPPTAPTAAPAPASAVVAPEPTTAQATGASKDAAAAGAAAPAPMVLAPPAPDVPPAPPTVPAEPVDPMAEKYKHIDVGVWFRVGAALQKSEDPKKLSGFGTGGYAELHFSNQMRKSLLWTANFAAAYGAPDGGSFVSPGFGGPAGVTGTVNVLDLIAQYEPDDAFHLWVGRMLVASDRSNFSGPWFMAPWIYPLFLGPQGAPFAIVGPQEGPNGRNDGATAWGQFQGGLLKYYLGAYRVFDDASPIDGSGTVRQKPLFSGRLNLSLLNPEPGYYSSSTYYGMDILAIGVGGQYSKNQDVTATGLKDYGMFNADILFEKNLGASGVFDAEGAFYKYAGDGEPLSWSHFVLASYLTPDTGVLGKLQPLVRLQQAIVRNDGPTVTQIDAQVTDVIDSYATRVTLGFTHAGVEDGPKSNAVFAGVQIQK